MCFCGSLENLEDLTTVARIKPADHTGHLSISTDGSSAITVLKVFTVALEKRGSWTSAAEQYSLSSRAAPLLAAVVWPAEDNELGGDVVCTKHVKRTISADFFWVNSRDK